MSTARINFFSHQLAPLRLALVCALVLLASCSYIPIAGGELKGTVVPAPASWPQVAATKVIELEAARVTAADEFGRFSDSYEKKYGRRPRNENITEVYLFRLQARQ